MLDKFDIVKNPYYLKDTEGNYYKKYPEFQVWEEGKQAGQESLIEAHLQAVRAARQDGIKEVVEWVDNNWLDQSNMRQWRSKLKEWGIDIK